MAEDEELRRLGREQALELLVQHRVVAHAAEEASVELPPVVRPGRDQEVTRDVVEGKGAAKHEEDASTSVPRNVPLR